MDAIMGSFGIFVGLVRFKTSNNEKGPSAIRCWYYDDKQCTTANSFEMNNTVPCIKSYVEQRERW